MPGTAQTALFTEEEEERDAMWEKER